jgi:3-deoxy-D-manno-octulosonic-acid transferase
MITFIWVVLYNLIFYPLLFLFGLIGSLFHAKLREGMKGRFRTIDRLRSFFQDVEPSRSVYWFHAASHGEYEQVRPVLAGLREVEPDSIFLVSFFSPSGYNNVNDPHIDCKIYLPFDFIWSVRRALKIARPKKVIFAAYDVWPNLIWVARRRRIHTTIFAAHLARGTKKLTPGIRSFYRVVYRSFATIYTVQKDDYLRLQRIVKSNRTPLIRVLGNPRYDQVKARADQITKERTISVLLREKRIVVGSVWPEDETVIAPALIELLKENEELKLLWVPHEPSPQYVEASLQRFRDQGFSTRTLKSKQHLKLDGAQVIVVGVVGVLARLYWQGQIAYVGGGFSTGVHNVMEPAIARLPVLFGPRYSNSEEAEALIEAGGGYSVKTSDEVYHRVRHLLEDTNDFLRASFAATEVIHRNLGSATRVVRGILRD